jgi:hypothetical protein
MKFAYRLDVWGSQVPRSRGRNKISAYCSGLMSVVRSSIFVLPAPNLSVYRCRKLLFGHP